MFSRDRVYCRSHPPWRMMGKLLQSCLCIGWQVLPKLLEDGVAKVVRPKRTNRLQSNALESTRSQQGPWARMLKMDDPVPDFDLPRTAVDQIYDLRGDLRGKTERVRRSRRRRLQAIPRLIRDSPRHGIGVRRERTKRGMVLGDIVDPSRNSSDLASFGQSAQCLIDGSAIAQVIEHPRGERCSRTHRFCALQNLQWEIPHVRNIILYF
jgi:hypothetical protein